MVRNISIEIDIPNETRFDDSMNYIKAIEKIYPYIDMSVKIELFKRNSVRTLPMI